MANFFSDDAEWEYLFNKGIHWETILPLYFQSYPTPEGFENPEEVKNFYKELLSTTGKWTAESLAPRARELDHAGGGILKDGCVTPTDVLAKTYSEVAAMDLFGMTLSPEYGGMGIPVAVGFFTIAQISRACISTSSQISFFSGIADMIERYCPKELKDKYVPMIIQGKISGSMCLTEPDAGSDVGALRTSAEKQADGTYLLNGTKTFITNGGGGLCFVLARVKGAAKGLEGISMFFVEQHRDAAPGQLNYRVAKIEEKLGLHGSPTCEVVYENSVAQLIGKENEGFKIMLHLMNEARILVGVQGLGGMEASVAAVRDYAAVRKQFGKPIADLPLMRRNIQDLETELAAFRVLMIDTCSYYDIFQLLHKKETTTNDLTADEIALLAKVSKIVRKRTPLVKYYGSEAFTNMSQKAIQAFGGYGFMQEYDVERLHRDSFAPLLYEGTSQIQALMAMKDYVKGVIKDPGGFVQRTMAHHPLSVLLKDSEYERSIAGVIYDFRKSVTSLFIRCFKPDTSFTESGITATLAQISKAFKMDYWQEEGRFDKLMVHAETLCQGLSYIETLKVLAQFAAKDESRGDLYRRYHKLVQPRLDAIYSDWKL